MAKTTRRVHARTAAGARAPVPPGLSPDAGAPLMPTLEAYVASYPSQDEAAHAIGVRTETLNRWLNQRTKPRGLSLRRLHELGVRA